MRQSSFERLLFIRLANKLLTFYGTRKAVKGFKNSPIRFYSEAADYSSETHTPFLKITFNIVLQLRTNLLTVTLPSDFPTDMLCAVLVSMFLPSDCPGLAYSSSRQRIDCKDSYYILMTVFFFRTSC
jgi:hypothetical protein